MAAAPPRLRDLLRSQRVFPDGMPGFDPYAAPDEVEFWQGDLDRRHVRLRYQRAGSAWNQHLLWP
jgi:pyridoxine/pyridoxamine 5'-phosphate oxidase